MSMKRLLLLTVAFLAIAGSTLMAQPQCGKKPQKMTEEQLSQVVATRMAHYLELDEAKTSKFVPIYVDYRKELKQVWNKYANPCPPKVQPVAKPQRPSDKELEQMTTNRFARSRATIDVEEAYYKRFLTVLTQRQYEKMQQLERMHLQRMKNERMRRMQKGKPGAKSHFPPRPKPGADAKHRKVQAPENQTADVESIEQQSKKSDRWVSMNGAQTDGTPATPGYYVHQGRKIRVK